jgi:competence protein ComEC
MHPVDKRSRVDCVLVVGLAMCAGGLACASPVEAGLASAILLVALALARGPAGSRPVVSTIAALAFLVGAARSSSRIRAYERDRAHVIDAARWPARCSLRGVVARSPVMLGDAFKVDVDVTRGECHDRASLHGRVTLHVPRAISPATMARGDTLDAVAQLAPGYRFWNDETGDPRPPQARRGVLLSGGAEDVVPRTAGTGARAIIDRARARLRERIVATFPEGTSAMARALVLGEDDLTSADQRAFRRSGLAHLLAVSGMHLVLVVATFVAVLRALFVRVTALATRVAPLRAAAVFGIPLAWIYADLAGGSGSAIRAAWMTSIALLAHVLSRRPDIWRAFGLSVLGMAIADPLVGFDLSFVLSAAATAGILALSPLFSRAALARTPAFIAPVVRATSASIAASIACAPVLACMTADLPLAGLVANLIAVPLGELAALPLCLAHGLLEPLPAAERGCAIAASGALALVRGVAHGFAAIPWGAAPVPPPTAGQLAAIAVGVAGATGAVTRHPWRWAAPCIVAFFVLEHAARARGSPKNVLRVSFLDVGQGDAAIVDLPDGTALVIDGGGLVGSPVDVGERVLAPVLRSRRRSAVAFAMLSHPHPDHFGGLRRGLAGVTVGALWDTGQGEAEGTPGDYAALLSELRARGSPILGPSSVCGSRPLGGARIEVLAPCPELAPDRGPNDNSFVVRIAYGDRAVLFVGDAEHSEESGLLSANPAALRADVLKVGHHGSRTSTTPAFLAAVDPSIAVISCGIRNRFGHPAPATLATLAASRTRMLRTDLDGAVTITTDGRSLEVHAAAD